MSNQSTESTLGGFIAGILLTMIGFMLITVAGVGLLADAREQIAICQESLPRNEHCVLVAVPEKADKAVTQQ